MRQGIYNNRSVMFRLFLKSSFHKTAKKVLGRFPLPMHTLTPLHYVWLCFIYLRSFRRLIYCVNKGHIKPLPFIYSIIFYLTYKVYINVCYWKPSNFHEFRYENCMRALSYHNHHSCHSSTSRLSLWSRRHPRHTDLSLPFCAIFMDISLTLCNQSWVPRQ